MQVVATIIASGKCSKCSSKWLPLPTTTTGLKHPIDTQDKRIAPRSKDDKPILYGVLDRLGMLLDKAGYKG